MLEKTKYTNSLEADKAIEKDAQIIKNLLIKMFNPVAIVFFGGFGHASGSYKKIKNKIVPLNDYDFYMITKKKISDIELEKAGIECSKMLGKGGLEIVENFSSKYDENRFFHVDIHNITENNLKNLMPTQRTFDLKTSLVIYGDKNILNKIPNKKISKSDAIRIFFNKLNHFAIAENNSKIIKSIYAIKGLTDLCSALLIVNHRYTSKYKDRVKEFEHLDVPKELKSLVKIATEAKLNHGYEIKNPDEIFRDSKKWVEWTLKKILKHELGIKSDDWKDICKIVYKKIPYVYFNDYLGNRHLFPLQYYLNVKFFLAGIRKKEFLVKNLFRWRDAGLILGIAMILYSFNEKQEAEKYLRKLTSKTKPLKERLMKLYSIYYLQKLI